MCLTFGAVYGIKLMFWGWVVFCWKVCERGVVGIAVYVVFGLSVRSLVMVVWLACWLGFCRGRVVGDVRYSLLLGFCLLFWVFGRVLWWGRSHVRLARVDCEVCGAALLCCLWCWGCVILWVELPGGIALALLFGGGLRFWCAGVVLGFLVVLLSGYSSAPV